MYDHAVAVNMIREARGNVFIDSRISKDDMVWVRITKKEAISILEFASAPTTDVVTRDNGNVYISYNYSE